MNASWKVSLEASRLDTMHESAKMVAAKGSTRHTHSQEHVQIRRQ
jgi:hypothetical protein